MEGEIRIDLMDSKPLVFANERRLYDFLKSQHLAWSELEKKYSATSNRDADLYRFLVGQRDGWASASIEGKNKLGTLASSSLEKIKQDLADGELICIENSLVSKAKAALEYDPEIFEFYLHIVSGTLHDRLEYADRSAEYLSWYAKGISHLATTNEVLEQFEDVESLNERAREKAALVDANLRKMLQDLQEETTAIKSEIQEFFEDAKGERLSASEQLTHLRVTYDNALKLSAPRTYWDTKKQDHGLIARNWRKAFFVVASVGVVTLTLMSVLMIGFWENLAKPLESHAWIVPVLMVGIPAFMVLWLLRLCGRLWTEHMTREEDARERIVMIETFLALGRSQDSPSALDDPTQLTLVLSAIFRAGPGFGSDDSPPAGLLDALVAKLGVSKNN